ncbi:hypothetical protein Q5752_002407 [Cryptotrichosporon argae]
MSSTQPPPAAPMSASAPAAPRPSTYPAPGPADAPRRPGCTRYRGPCGCPVYVLLCHGWEVTCNCAYCHVACVY